MFIDYSSGSYKRSREHLVPNQGKHGEQGKTGYKGYQGDPVSRFGINQKDKLLLNVFCCVIHKFELELC